MKRIPWIELLAAAPFALLFAMFPDPIRSIASVDPLVIFRVLMLLWLVAHVVILARRFIADIQSIREFLGHVERIWPEATGVAGIGDRVLKWSAWRVAGLLVRHGWPTLLLFLATAAVNAATWMVLAGRWPAGA